jgi:choline dehydrogenase-like flavoprotein
VRLVRLGRVPRNLKRHLGNIIHELDKVAIVTARRQLQWGARKGTFRVRSYAEQTPNPDSRITLSNRRDALGRQRIRVDWRLSELDLQSIRRAHQILATAVQQAGIGEFTVALDDTSGWRSQIMSGYHHMGTTRMHVDPRRGVVDADSRVHGMSNLFVTGSSVFPTSGYQNPTLTVVALAIRLADHLKARLSD